MIDFRYHVVSLMSVFLALAVGIVLGAGPLQSQLGTALKHEVKQLAAEKAQLRTELDASDLLGRRQDDYISSLGAQVTAGRLTSRSLAVVALPGVESSAVSAVVDAVKAAGGTVAARVSVQSDWTDTGETERRTSALQQIAAADHQTDASDADVTGQLSAALARALATPAPVASLKLSATSSTVLDVLSSAGLVRYSGKLQYASSGVVVIAPAVDSSADAPSPTPTNEVQTRIAAWLRLAQDLDSRSDGAVVVGPLSAAGDDGLIAAVRADDTAASTVSTVDEGTDAMGCLSTVLALRLQFTGQAGAYGHGDGADSVVPGSSS